MAELYFSKPECWAPGLEDNDTLWQQWAAGKIQIQNSCDAPKLEFTTPVFRRRLSQISRMTIQVVHALTEKIECKNLKQVFVSTRGEINRELQINSQLINDKEILPAAFSLSVFNAPVALATLACKLTAGYSVMFPSRENFYDALCCACSPVLCGDEKEIIFIYADECVPQEYSSVLKKEFLPFSFACIISSEKKDGWKKAELPDFANSTFEEFLKYLLT
ncbi:MAG: beta-ketoacyl synthase chain length factor [Spirochaetales bacterium]|nr:beta-ketoacyl synthase chain length factor [Spirochaetales bacterium]